VFQCIVNPGLTTNSLMPGKADPFTYRGRRELVVRNLETGKESVVVNDLLVGFPGMSNYQWSPDDRWIGYSGNDKAEEGEVFVVEINPDGTFKAALKIREGLAPGKYSIVAVVDKGVKSQPVTFENTITFPNLYLSNAGTSLNLIWPFLLSLAISIFGVLMGAGGGFILNPLLVSLWPLPHTVVAGTVMPTVLFSQGSGIYNYSRIKFINWKLGITIGLGMLLGGFIGPKLTELITLDQYKFVFGWILVILAGLMFWQTTPGYLDKNKKEQAILKEFRRRAEETIKAKGK